MRKKINKKNKKNTPYYIWGIHASLAAINNKNRIVKKIYCNEKNFETISSLKKDSEIKIKVMKNNNLDTLIKENISHQGIILETMPLNYPNFEDVLKSDELLIVLDQITDPQNMGAIIRSMNFFGAKTIITTKDHSAEINGSLAKSASGSLESVNIIEVTNLAMSLDKIKKNNFIIIGLDENSEVYLENMKNYKDHKKALVLGSEGRGLRRLTKEKCDLLMSINNKNNINFTTLNVSVSSAVALYELTRKNI
ncbi:MAG: 23S rRNA (guanosine(2251)-2'-O)-methyltransferase RlmB [Pseudomonadota bacterium]|nr:23S rRNA (guanosine(2251)-2'-O)-methyltransferase RlmB [Pseudomonadota bacterium]